MKNEQFAQAAFGQRLRLVELRRFAPGLKAPEAALQAWRDFLNEYGPGDEIWTYRTEPPRPRAAWAQKAPADCAGFVIVRGGRAVANFHLLPGGETQRTVRYEVVPHHGRWQLRQSTYFINRPTLFQGQPQNGSQASEGGERKKS